MAATIPRQVSQTSRSGRWGKNLVLPAFTGCDVTVIAVMLALFALGRAADLSYSVSHEVTLAELAIPIEVWATGFYAVAWLLLVGVAAQKHFIMWCGHAVGLVLYFGLSVGALLHLITVQRPGPITALLPAPWWFIALAVIVGSVIIAAATTGDTGHPAPTNTKWATIAVAALLSFTPLIPLDGSRQLGPLICVMVMHGFMAARMGPWPLTASELGR